MGGVDYRRNVLEVLVGDSIVDVGTVGVLVELFRILLPSSCKCLATIAPCTFHLQLQHHSIEVCPWIILYPFILIAFIPPLHPLQPVSISS